MAGFGFGLQWQEWEDNKKLLVATFGAMIILYLIVFGIFTIFPQEQSRIGIFQQMLLITLVAAVVDYLVEKNPLFSFAGLGELQRAVIGFVVGAGITAFFLFGSHLSVAIPLQATTKTIVNPTIDTWIYVVAFAPFVEDLFFVGFLYFTLYGIFNYMGLKQAGIIALILTSAFFGLYHLYAYGFNFDAAVTAAIWRASTILLALYFRSIGASMGMHFANNYLTIKALLG